MNTKTAKRKRDLKTKLMAAVAMLLVSSLMMVTSTYAWFTLSTAPEVTGISTAVGANGNLEMALLPTDGLTSSIKSEVGDSYATTKNYIETNITWGNLVDLNEGYGLDKITLYPSQLNVATSDVTDKPLEGNPLTLAEMLLKTPAYGADGRISELLANTVTSTYDGESFPQNTDYGVRAVGTASGMTDRQLAYRNARSAASTAMAQAKNGAASSLSTNGNALADIAIKRGTDAAAKYTQAEVESLLAIVDDLLGTESKTGILEYIEKSYIQYILAYGASQASVTAGMNDTMFNAFRKEVERAADLSAVTALLTTHDVTLESQTTTAIDALAATKANVEDAQSKLNKLVGTGDEITWESISPALYLLANTDAMTVNGIKASEIMDNVDALVKTVGNGITVSMATGGGVYADVADHCGDYQAGIKIKEIKYGSLEVTDMDARMATASTVNPSYLSTFGSAVQAAQAPESASGTKMPITDMYGYIIDLAFRTNAAESNLLLQQEGIDRIYDENGNEETMGSGSTMTFAATTPDFSDEKVKDLMEAIRIVFFQKGENTNTVLATAKLDVDHATTSADGITAELYLYTVTAGGEEVYVQKDYTEGATDTFYTKSTENVDTYTEVNDTFASNTSEQLYTKATDSDTYTEATYSSESGLTYYTKKTVTTDVYTAVDANNAASASTGTLYIKTVTTAGENEKTDDVITALTQNEATQVSVLVYLDGNHVTNAEVAATAGTSVTGTMNLQFASSANLVPMEYANLHQPGTTTVIDTITVTGANGVTSEGTFDTNGKVKIELTNVPTEQTVTGVTVGSNTINDFTYDAGVLTFTHKDIKATDTVTITIGAKN